MKVTPFGTNCRFMIVAILIVTFYPRRVSGPIAYLFAYCRMTTTSCGTHLPKRGRVIGVIELSPSLHAGSLDGEVEVQFGGARPVTARIPITGEVIRTVRVQPESLYLPWMASGQQTWTVQSVISNRDGEPLRAELISVPSGLRAALTPTPSGGVELTVQCSEQGRNSEPRRSELAVRLLGPTKATVLSIPITHP